MTCTAGLLGPTVANLPVTSRGISRVRQCQQLASLYRSIIVIGRDIPHARQQCRQSKCFRNNPTKNVWVQRMRRKRFIFSCAENSSKKLTTGRQSTHKTSIETTEKNQATCLAECQSGETTDDCLLAAGGLQVS